MLAHRTADLFFALVVELARGHGWVSDEHFTVDGTLIEAWEGDARAAQRSLRDALAAKPIYGPRAVIARLSGSR